MGQVGYSVYTEAVKQCKIAPPLPETSYFATSVLSQRTSMPRLASTAHLPINTARCYVLAGSTLQVINPLEVLCGHSSPHSNRLSSCSTSSQDTVTTGSGIGVNLDCSRSCGSPRGGPHAAMPAAGAGGLHVPASQGRSLDGSMAAATGTAAPVGGATPHNSQNGSSNNMWEMSTVSTMDSQAARAWAVQPAATAAAAAAPAGPKDAMLLPTIKDSTLLLPDMQQLVVQQMSLSAQQQMVVPPQQQQQHSIQVHYAMHDTNTVAAAAAVTAATTAAAVAATTAASGGVVKLAAVSSNTVKQLQELLPSVAATHAAVDTGAAAKQNDRDYVGSSSSSGSGGGGRKGRAVRLFSRLRLMSRGFSGRMGSRSSLRSSASATNEHLLGFTGWLHACTLPASAAACCQLCFGRLCKAAREDQCDETGDSHVECARKFVIASAKHLSGI